jgi:hypothetical protein
MISGTAFTIEDAAMVEAACRHIRAGIASPSEIVELKAQCEHGTAICVACEDGTVVFDVRYVEAELEMFVWLAVAFRHGAFQRQESAMLNIARDLGAKTLAFQTRRKGWGRRLGTQWRRRGSLEFVRYVDERQ